MDFGLNCRGSSVFVTDSAPNTYLLASDANVGDVTRGGGTFSLTATPGDIHCDDLSLGVDTRLAGRTYADPTKHGTLKIALTAYGVDYDVRLAIGDAINDQSAQHQIVKIYDGDPDGSGSLVTTIDKVSGPPPGQWYDATGVLRTSSSDWATNNAAIIHSFGSDLYVVYGAATAGYTLLAHVRVTTSASGGGPPTLASPATPGSAYANSSIPVRLIGVSFMGTNLDGGSGAFDAVTGFTFSNLNISGPTALTVDIQLAAGLSPGSRNLTFTTTGGTSNAVAFIVTDPGGGSGRISSGDMRGGFVN